MYMAGVLKVTSDLQDNGVGSSEAASTLSRKLSTPSVADVLLK